MLAYRRIKRPKHLSRDCAIALFCLLVAFAYVRPALQRARDGVRDFFSCSQATVSCERIYCAVRKREIVAFVRKATANANILFFHAADFYADLGKRFPGIDKVMVKKKFPAGLEVIVFGVDPLCCVNDNLMLGHDGHFYERSLFSRFASAQQLKVISVPAAAVGTCADKDLLDFITELPATVTHEYLLTYHSASHLVLTPKEAKPYASIIADRASLRENGKTSIFEEVTRDILQRGLCSTKKMEQRKTSVQYDIRFNNRIIVKFFEQGKRGRLS